MKLTPEERARRSANMKQVRANAAAEKSAKRDDLAQELSANIQAGLTPPSVRSVSERPTRNKPQNLFNGQQKKLTVFGEIPGYDLYVFNDAPGRIDTALKTGWEFVTRDEVALEVSRTVTDSNTAVDSRIRFLVGKTGVNEDQPLYGFLMKIPSEWRAQNQAEEQDMLDAAEKALIGRGGSEALDNAGPLYLPNGRKSALTIRQSRR